ncbi:MAG TPA: choice-of-anchor D domain-containing protein [Edaphobacter sp.]
MKYGLVQGGVVPVSGASVQMYAVGTTGDGSAATPLFATPLTTDSDGKFDSAGAYTCPTADTLVYMVATGGDPGNATGSVNPQISMMAALGRCGDLTPTTNVTINEVTTVAAVWMLAPYMQSATAIGADSSHPEMLAAAFQMALLLANPATGATPGANAPNDATLPIAEINTLADILSACVDSTGGAAGDGSACGTLFSAVTQTNGIPPSNTLSAALLIANNPMQGIATLYGLLPANPPFQPVLTSAPASFTLPTTFPSGLAVSPNPASFPNIYVGQVSQLFVNLTNHSSSEVHFQELVLSGANATEFTIFPNSGGSSCSTTTALAAGTTCVILVESTPVSAGTKMADLTIVSDAQNPLIHVALNGQGSDYALTFSPSSLSFPSTPVGTTTVPQMVTVTNHASLPISLGAQLVGANSAMYVLGTSSCLSATLAAGASCTFPVLFRPTTVGTLDSTIQFTGGFSVSLHGTGLASTAPLPLSFSSTSLAFPDTMPGLSTLPTPLTITNVGSTAVDVAVQLVDEQGQPETDSVFYVGSTPSCLDLRPAASCRISVVFAPIAAGLRTPVLRFLSIPAGAGDWGSPAGRTQTVALSGTGLERTGGPLTLSPSGGLSFSQYGAAQIATLENDGDTPVSILSINYRDNTCGTTLAAHAQCQISVDGTYGNVTVDATSSATPYTLPVSVPPDPVTIHDGVVVFQTTPIGGYSTAEFSSSGGVSATVLQGQNSYEFAGDSCSVNVHMDCFATVSFAPINRGLRHALVNVTSTAMFGSPTTMYRLLGFSGDKAGADFTLTQNDFPNVIVPGYVGMVTLTNTGTNPLLLYQANPTQTAQTLGAGFSGCYGMSFQLGDSNVYGDVSYSGIYVPVGQSCTLAVYFSASQGTGTQQQSFSFTDAFSQIARGLQFTGEAGAQEAAPTISGSTDVGEVPLGEPTTPISLTINAPNGDGVTLGEVTTSPSTGIAYTIDPSTCAQQTPCQITVSATPSVGNTFSISSTIYDPITGLSTPAVLLQGFGGHLIRGTFVPSTVYFDPQKVNTTSAVHTVTVINTGHAPLIITGVTVNGYGAPDFSVDSSACTQSAIPVEGSCSLSVTFTPNSADDRLATLQLISNEQTPSSVSLSGYGTQ